MMIYNLTKRSFLLGITLLFILSIVLATPIYAEEGLTESQKAIINGTTFYDPSSSYCSTDQSNPLTSTNEDVDLPNGLIETDRSKANDERVWQFLVDPDGLGLNEYEASGFMGNIRQESGGNFDPNAIEDGGGGYGIIQWTGGRRTKIETYITAMQATYPSADLMDLQLSYLRKELTKDYKDTYTMLTNQTIVTVKPRGESAKTYNDPLEAAVLIVHGPSGAKPQKFTIDGLSSGFEASGDELEAIVPGNRYIFALEYYKKFTGKTPSSSTSSVASDCTTTENGTTGSAGVYGWDLDGANKMYYYEQSGKSWSDEYFGPCGNIGVCGCPIVAVASIVSTLTTNKDDPAELLKSRDGGFSQLPTQFELKRTVIMDGGAANWAEAARTLRAGGLILAYAQAGTFTSSQHYFVIRKVSEDGNSFYVYDLKNPKSEINNTAYSQTDLLGAGNIKELYGYTK